MPAWWRSSCGSPCRDGSVFTKNKNAGLTSSVFSATIHLAFAGVAHLVERDLAKVEVASSSLVARSKIETPSERMVFSFWNIAADGFELAASTCAKRVKSRGGAGFPRMALPFVGCREASSSLVARSKKTRPPFGWSCFLWHAAGRGSKGYERSEKNMPGARFGARVRVAARQRRERASSPAGQGSKRSPARTACQFRWRR